MRVPFRRLNLRTILIVGLFAASCTPVVARSSAVAVPSASALRASISDRLYFGRSIPGGGTVSEADWAAFLREVVTPRFPAGLTMWRAEGQWRDRSGAIVREESFVLELIHSGDLRAEARVGEIIAEYRSRFRQESVLRVRSRVDVGY